MTTSVLSARGAPPSPVRRGPTPVALGSGLPLALTRRLSHRSRGPHHRSPHLAHTRSTRAQGCRASFGPQALCSMGLAVACVLWATAAGAQTTSTTTTTPAQQSSTSQSSDASRPATTTFFGDTGLWFVPTAEVLPAGTWSVSGYRRGTSFIQGYTNVADFAGTFGVGIGNRAEIFGAFLFDTRIDRDVKPLFSGSLRALLVPGPDPSFGGIVDRYPRVHQAWTGDNVGDLYVGAKVNLWSEYRQNPAAIAIRGLVKLPTGKDDIGTSTGKADLALDLIVSKELAKLVDWAGHAGYEFRGSPDGFDLPSGAFQWGTGVA